MPTSDILAQAYLVVDNSVLVMLHEYFCERQLRRLPVPKLIPSINRWMTDQVDILRALTPHNLFIVPIV